jgi:hypothetical protein
VIALLALPVAAVLLTVAGLAGEGAVGALVLIVVLVAAVMAPGALGVRAGRAMSAAIIAAGATGVVLAWIEAARDGGSPSTVEHLAPALAAVVPLAALAMLVDRGDRRDLVMNLALTSAIGASAVLGSAWMAIGWAPIGDAGLVVSGMAIAGAGVALLLGPWWAGRGLPREGLLVAAVVMGVLGGLIGTLFLDVGELSWLTAAALAFVAAAVAVIARTWVMLAVSERVDDPADGRTPDFDQGTALATCLALLLPAMPVFVFARIMVG